MIYWYLYNFFVLFQNHTFVHNNTLVLIMLCLNIMFFIKCIKYKKAINSSSKLYKLFFIEKSIKMTDLID
jgi:hypothetical protein